MVKYWLIFGGFCACLFALGEIFAFVYDVEPNHMAEILGKIEYDRQQKEQGQDYYVSFQEWLEKQNETKYWCADYFLDEVANSLDIFSSPSGVNSDNYERR